MTERYAHLLPDVKRKAINRLAETFESHIENAEAEENTKSDAVYGIEFTGYFSLCYMA